MSKQELIQRQFDVSRRYHANEKLNHAHHTKQHEKTVLLRAVSCDARG